MKKALSLLLALVMCLSLCACTITINLPGASGSHDIFADSGSDDDSSKADHELLCLIYGFWEVAEGDIKYNPYSSLTVLEDGTCLIDGKAASWKVADESNDNDLFIDIFVDGDRTCGALLMCSGYRPWFYAVDANGGICMGAWENSAEIPTDENDIVLTTENWRDYFELRVGEEFIDDAFGDLDRIHLYQYLALKEEYAQNILMQDVVVEMTVTGQRTEISVDPENRTYSLGEVIKDEEIHFEPEKLSSGLTIPVFGNNYINIQDHLNPDSMNSKTVIWIPSLEAIEMLRIKGTILIRNN